MCAAEPFSCSLVHDVAAEILTCAAFVPLRTSRRGFGDTTYVCSRDPDHLCELPSAQRWHEDLVSRLRVWHVAYVCRVGARRRFFLFLK